ncbi:MULTISPECIES: hypothetical protein [unclassified Nostoc]|uniref:hypothetical protein n=1 Tax=unclassified Nostoc TaxID=2593658 RepID=UPI002AD571E5|nr:hypothetical protein [Nostoc sp. DedQUE03]MDZ7971847.1 hypothetical protein [Nostoc sp. DedQUE03]MDZ8048970.1 hypothetical protein [Nostoc sp. DedQUE02]
MSAVETRLVGTLLTRTSLTMIDSAVLASPRTLPLRERDVQLIVGTPLLFLSPKGQEALILASQR